MPDQPEPAEQPAAEPRRPASERRLVVELTPKADRALHRRMEAEDLNKTQAASRALTLYDDLMAIQEAGGDISVRRPGEDRPTVWRLL